MAVPDDHLRLKILGSIGVAMVVLLGLLAYTFGASTQEGKDLLSIKHEQDIFETISKRYKLCQLDILHLSSNSSDTLDKLQRKRDEQMLILQEAEYHKENIDSLTKALEECEQQEAFKGGEVDDTLATIMYQHKELLQAKAAVNSSKRGEVQLMRLKVEALRKENAELRNELQKKTSQRAKPAGEEALKRMLAEAEEGKGAQTRDVSRAKQLEVKQVSRKKECVDRHADCPRLVKKIGLAGCTEHTVPSGELVSDYCRASCETCSTSRNNDKGGVTEERERIPARRRQKPSVVNQQRHVDE